MKVILIQDVPKLGKFGDIKEVADGYARNYLLPNKLVLVYNEQNLRYIENLKKNLEYKKQKEEELINQTKHNLERASITVSVDVGKDNKVYGAVTKEDIVEAIEQQVGIKVDKHNIKLTHPIKEIGVFNVNIQIPSKKFPQISATASVKILVVGKEKVKAKK